MADKIEDLKYAEHMRGMAIKPIPMILFCPRCGKQHIDRPEPNIGWDNPPHRSHACQTPGCKTVWRTADVPTTGVASIDTAGASDTWRPGEPNAAARVASVRESNLEKYAERELRAAGMFDADADYGGGTLANAVLTLIRAFAAQGHSGGSAPTVISLFTRLARFEPLSPLTGADDEWNEVGNGVWQNRRQSSVFKERDGRAYDIDAVLYEQPNGVRFQRGGERSWITFPYMPGAPRVIKVDDKGNVLG